MPGRHRLASRRGRQTMRGPLTVIAVGVLVGLTAIAVQVVAADVAGCRGGVRLTVAAAPEIAPAVREVARRWMADGAEVNRTCVQVQVRSVAPADVASSLAAGAGGSLDVVAQPAATPPPADLPAVWIPDSIAWLARTSAVDRNAIADATPSIAMSPVVLGMPEAVAATLATTASGGGARGLLPAALADAQRSIQERRPPQFAIAVVDPRRDTASLAGMMLVRDAVVTDETKLPALIAAYRVINRTRVAEVTSLPKAFTQGAKVAVMSEQAIIATNSRASDAPLTAVPLAESSPCLDYPYALLAGKPREVELAAAKFRTALTLDTYREAFAKAGFRSPDGSASPGFAFGHGITATRVTPHPIGDSTRIAETLGYWSAANTPSRALTLIDISSSMGNLVPGQARLTRLGLLQQAAQAGLRLFADASSLGLWTFASGHTEVAPIMPLTDPNRALLSRKIASIRPVASDESNLFGALRDAYRVMIQEYDPAAVNRIIVFSDGRSSTREIKNLQQLNRQLETLATVTKPIEVTLIGVGGDVAMSELEEIARMTDGVATRIRDVADIETVFLRALLA